MGLSVSLFRSRAPLWLYLLTGWAALLVALFWAFEVPLREQASIWWNDPDYNYAFLVPVFSGVLLWLRRDQLRPENTGGRAWGLVLLALAAALRCTAAYEGSSTLDRLALLPTLAGASLFVGGVGVLRWAWPSIAFLVFMVPIPNVVNALLSYPAQRLGTVASIGLLQILGVPALARGNVLFLRHTEIGVVEACSGLRMLELCLALMVATILVARLSRWEKLTVALSAVPIAVIVNVVRLTVSAIFQTWLGLGSAGAAGHELSGWLAMPLAAVLFWSELSLLARLRQRRGSRPAESVGEGGQRLVRCAGATSLSE